MILHPTEIQRENVQAPTANKNPTYSTQVPKKSPKKCLTTALKKDGSKPQSLVRYNRIQELRKLKNKSVSKNGIRALSSNKSVDKNVSGSGEGIDEKTLHTVISDNQERLFRFIHKNISNTVVAQDLAQQTFVEAMKNYQNFRGDSAPSTWLFGIARNIVRNYIYRSPDKRYSFVGEDVLASKPSLDHNPEEAASRKEDLAHIENLMRELPKKLREVLIFVAFREMSYDDAGQHLNISVGTVRSRLSRARTYLRSKLSSRSLPPAVKLPQEGGHALYQSLRDTFHSSPGETITTVMGKDDDDTFVQSRDDNDQRATSV